jgi:phosphoserine phosphatase RsbU/P
MKSNSQTFQHRPKTSESSQLCNITATDDLEKRLVLLEKQNQRLQDQLAILEQQRSEEKRNAKTSELQLAELIIDNSPAILFRRLAHENPKKRKMVYVSPNISRFGYRAEDFIRGRIMYRDILYKGDFERTLQEIKHFVDNKTDTYTQVYRIITQDGDIRWVEDRTSVIEDISTGTKYHQGIVIDIHRRKEAEEKVRKSEERYRRIVETTGEGFLLMDQNHKIIDFNTAFARMVHISRSELKGRKAGDLFTDDYRESWSLQNQQEAEFDYREFECEIIRNDHPKFPVLVHANTLRSDSDTIIGYMAFVTDITGQKKALSLAGEVQRSLLPEQAPKITGLDIAGKNIPCDEVGGDYFDYLTNNSGSLTVVVGDITGHGVDSALLMTSARAFLRMRASQPGTLNDILTEMNQHLTEDIYETGRFMTLFCLSLTDKPKRRIQWIRAGHDPALLYDPLSDQFEDLKGPGLALGVDRDYSFLQQQKDDLNKGTIIAIGTDGIWESRNKRGEMFGKDRLKHIIRKNASSKAEIILNKVLHEQALFTQGIRTEDDITLVVIKIDDL